MKLDITTELTPKGYIFKIDNRQRSIRAFSTQQDAFNAGWEVVNLLRQTEVAMLMSSAWDKATDEERLHLGEMNSLDLLAITKREVREEA